MPVPPTVRFEAIIEFFRGSSFESLALDHAGQSLRLCRESTQPLATVHSPSVGVVDPAPGRQRLPAPGEHVTKGAILLTLRRFKGLVEVHAPSDGTVAALHVERGTFVQFDQPLVAMAAP